MKGNFMLRKIILVSLMGMMSIALVGCSKEKQASKDAIIDHTQGQLNQMKDDIKQAEDLKEKAFNDAEKMLGKQAASE